MAATEEVTVAGSDPAFSGLGRGTVGPWWRDALRRRMLACADAGTVAVFSVSVALLLRDEIVNAFWVAALLPAWIVLAKLHGLYDRDHRALRHLTADELPNIFLWVVTGSTLTVLVVPRLTGQDFMPGRFLQVFAITFAAAVFLRAAARFAWRRLVPPDRTVI